MCKRRKRRDADMERREWYPTIHFGKPISEPYILPHGKLTQLVVKDAIYYRTKSDDLSVDHSE